MCRTAIGSTLEPAFRTFQYPMGILTGLFLATPSMFLEMDEHLRNFQKSLDNFLNTLKSSIKTPRAVFTCHFTRFSVKRKFKKVNGKPANPAVCSSSLLCSSVP